MSQVQLFAICIGVWLVSSESCFVSESDVTHYFYNQANPSEGIRTDISNASDVTQAGFSPEKDTFFYVHGWNDYYTSTKTVQKIKNALLKKYDINFFVFDWSLASNSTFYISSFLQTERVGRYLADFMEKFSMTGLLDFNRTTLCGHSLGAHVAGVAGTDLGGRLYQVVGLDPTSILFSPLISSNRIAKSSGQFVEIIHTNGLGSGYILPSGHADYYVNGGWMQIPSCGIELFGTCSHLIAIDYYVESLLTGNFMTKNCLVNILFIGLFCKEVSYMGEYNLDRRARGSYFLDTNAKSPFAKGY
ncbi:endothelial lipase-like [Diabrotica virgifera virgifera]|uniref:Endothelial lipase-like n=1 Tax=Diabrotica virgifera virgifera TaxID=50390 RepID=A0A6P7F4I2_DIAVI|nr:endothelial lipase-like [Diabrotica virgifera virgifera]